MFARAWRRFLAAVGRCADLGFLRDKGRRQTSPLVLEPLEVRIVPSTDSWLNPAGGSWDDAADWSTGATPTAADDVVINLPSAATVRLSGASVSVHSLQVNNSLILDGASLSVAGDVTNAGEIDLISTGGSADVTLTVGGLLTNTSTGLLSSEQGAGGGRYIHGNMVNQGTVDAQAGTSLVLLGINSSGPDITQAGGALTAENGGSVVQGGGRFHFTGGTLNGEVVVVDSELDIQQTVTGAAVLKVRGQGNVLDRNLAPGVTLRVQGSGYNGDGVLSAVDGAVNDGTIDLDSIGGGWNSSLDVAPGGTLTNSDAGAIDIGAGSGGGRYIRGNILNQGLIDLAPGAWVTILGTAAGGPNLTQTGGAIVAEAGAGVVQGGGAFHYAGGALSGEYIVVGTELDIHSGASGASVIEVRGQGNVLDENAAPGVTLWVQGSNWNGDGSLTAVDGAVNDGVIDLDSLGYSWWNSDLYVSPGGTFTNGATGLIQVRPGAGGGRGIHGTWVNLGTVDVLAGANLGVWGVNGAGANFTQAGGSLTAENGASLVQIGGLFRYTGGALNGEIVALDSELDVEASVTATSVLKVRGQNNTLDRNLAPGVTLWVQGSSYNGDGVLTAADGAVNEGTIDLESIQSDWSSRLAVAGGGTFTNAAGGVVAVNGGSGGARSIVGNIVNQGTLSANTNVYLSGNVTNSGTVAVAASVQVDLTGLGGAAPALSQTAGALDVDGTLILHGGALDVEGGALDGGGAFLVEDARLSFGPGAAGGPLAVQAVGQGNVLLNNLAAGVTVWVRGDDRFNQAVLTTAAGAANAGTLLLESASSWWWSALSLQGVFDNTPTGVIQVSRGAGGGRSIAGDLSNEGTIAVDAEAAVEIDGNGGGGPTLTQNGGVIRAAGRLLLNGGLLDFEGGSITGAFYAENAQLYISPDVSDPSLIHAVGGGDVLLDNASAATMIVVQGDDGFNAGVLMAAPDATNAGVIRLDSSSANWGSALVVQDMLDNTPTGEIDVAGGAGGGRWVYGDLDNEGTLSVAAGASLEIDGNGSGGPTLIQDGGTVRADGRLVLNGGLFDFESGDVSGSFTVHNSQIYVGPGAVDPATINVVGPGNTLLGNEGPSVTLLVEGDDGFNAGVLTAAAGAVNAGSIVLDSTSAYWGSALDAPDTLLNAGGGLIAVADGGAGGTRSLAGAFVNAGTIFVPPDRTLSLDGVEGGAGPTLIQSGGLISGGRFVQDGGLFDFESGQVTGDFAVNGAKIYVGPAVTSPSGVQVVGPYNTLLDNASAVTTLWVRGDDAYNQAVLTAAPGAGNSGTILLASASPTWQSVLAAPQGFVNRAGAQIAAYGGGGAAALMGTVTNDGYLSLSGVAAMHIDGLVNDGVVGVDATGRSPSPGVEALADTGAPAWAAAAGGSPTAPTGADGAEAVTHLDVGTWTNNGVIGVDPGTRLEAALSPNGAFTQAGGLVAVAGSFVVQGGLFHFTGGAVSGEFDVRDGRILVEPSVAVPSVVGVVGSGNVLLGNNSAAVALDVRGGSPLGDGDAVLTAADGSTNLGSIILETLDGTHHGYLQVPQGRFTNGAGGLIRVVLPAGDAGAGSIQAGRLEDDAAVADATGLPVTPPLLPALLWSPCDCAGDGSSDGGDGSSGGGSVASGESEAEAAQARMARTPGVADGVIAVADVGAGPDATGLSYSCACGWVAPTDGSSGGGTSPDGSTQDLLSSLYNLGQVVIGPAQAGGNLLTGLAEAANLASDAGWGELGLASVGAHALLGTPAFNPTPQSAFLRAAESAGDHGQLWSFLGQTVASTAWNVATLPGRAYESAGPAFAAFSATGDLGPLVSWAGTYGPALAGLAEGAAGLLEGGAGLLRAADAGALAAEAAGAPAWLGAAGALGASDGVLAFLADESGALDLNVLFGLGGEEEGAALGAGQGPVAAAQSGLGAAVEGVTTAAEGAAAAGDAAGAAALVEGTEAALTEQAAAVAEGGASAADLTAEAQALEEQAAEVSAADAPEGSAGASDGQPGASSQPTALQLLGNGRLAILDATEQQTIEFTDPNWRNTRFASANDSLVYVLRDANTGQLLKVGTSKVGTFLGRFGPYEAAQAYTGRSLAVDVFAFDGATINPTTVESEVRSSLISQGESLPWDNTRLPGAGGQPRLGRPGPGVPGTRASRALREQGWRWVGENFIQSGE